MKIGLVGIIIKGDRTVASAVQQILSEYGDLIVGRMGLPNMAQNVSMITLGVKGDNDRISAMAGKLGRLKNVKVKSVVTDVENE